MNEIEKMAAIIEADYKEWLDITGCLPDCSSYYYECLGGAKDSAEKLYNAGYGDVKQALEDYATKLHNNIVVYLKRDFDTREEVCKIIDETLKEVCGE